jgi:hypothetical protein
MAEQEQTTGRKEGPTPPLAIAEIVAHDNEPASVSPPKETAERLSTRTV